SVKGKIYYMLGVICEIYPEYMTTDSTKLLDIYKSSLKSQMMSKTNKPEMTIISGCLEGLTSYLVNFTQQSGDDSCYYIYKYCKMALKQSTTLTRYEVPKAGLHLLSKHASQFNEFLIDDYEDMYDRLYFWSHHHNRDILHVGMCAMESFLKEVNMSYLSFGDSVFFFIKQFRQIMNSSESSDKEVSLAIKGYGLLAGPCRRFLNVTDVVFMLSEMLNKCEQQFLLKVGENQDKMYGLHSYLDAIANIIKEIDELSETYASIVEHLLVMQIQNMPMLNEKMHFMATKSVIHVLLALMCKGSVFNQVLSGVVYQSVIRTCSHPIVLETEQTDDDTLYNVDVEKQSISYKSYLNIWNLLMDSPEIKVVLFESFALFILTQLTDALYNELMNSVIKVLNKLDLTSTTSTELTEQMDEASTSGGDVTMETDDVSADPTSSVHASKPKDFQVFINLVDFCRELLPNKHINLFENWIFTFSHNIILLSTQNPLVSGFYKLLALCMKISNKLAYFQVNESNEQEKQKAVCYLLIKKFSKEVLVRMKQYQDDLLAACLTLILSLPKEIITEQMIDVVPAIQVALTLGLSYLPLAGIAIDALEYWCHNLPDHIVKPHYSCILPYLDNYIRTVDKGMVAFSIFMWYISCGMHIRFSLLFSSFSSFSTINCLLYFQSYESKLGVIKDRVVQYLGSLGGSINYTLLTNSQDDISKQAIAWDTEQHLRFETPFIDMKPIIYFDPFLPHVVELASTSSDRQTKVAACELLHSLILYCLGRGAQQPGEVQKRYPMQKLYKKLFPAMLKLACDVEQVAKQLFEPLTMQLIHWFTNNKMGESSETMALLDTIFDSIIQADDTSLRDFSGKCLREFLHWSLKQSSVKTVEKSPVNASSILRRIFSFALHPSVFKRLGAALAFNNIYQIFREEKSLVDRYTFQILVHFVESLSLAHKDDKSLGTQEQCAAVLKHLQRIIIFHEDILKKPSKIRQEPREWSNKTLDIAVRWLSRQCGRPQTECRHTCMKLVYNLCTHVQGNYFVSFDLIDIVDKSTIIKKVFEGGGTATHGKSGISACSTLLKISDTFTLTSTMNWFDMLLAGLDCYTWVFGEDLLTPINIFSGTGSNTSKLFESLEYFLSNISLRSIDEVSKLFKESSVEYFTPREIEDFNRNKCTVIVRITNFLSVLIGKYPKDAIKVIPGTVWSDTLWELLIKCVVQPQSVGFNMGDVEVMNNLPSEVPTKLMFVGITNFSDLFSLLTNLSLNNPVVGHTVLQHLVSGYILLNKTGLLVNTNVQQLVFDTVYKVCIYPQFFLGMNIPVSVPFSGIYEEKGKLKKIITLTPAASILGKSLLDLSFKLGLKDNVLITALLNDDMIQGKTPSVNLQHGEAFFLMFKSVICQYIAENGRTIIPILTNQAKTHGRKVNSILGATVDYIARDRTLRKKEGPNVASTILSEWKKFSTWWTNNAPPELQNLAISLLTKVLLIDSRVTSHTSHPSFSTIFEMYQTMLVDNKTNLAFKNKVLDLLPFFAMAQETYITKLKSSLDRFVADNFPIKSNEFTKGSPRYQDYISAINKILLALELSGCSMLLELLISIFCRESKHVYEDEIQDVIARYTKRLVIYKQKLALDIPYKIFTSSGSYPSAIRIAALSRVCLPMLRLVHKSAVIEFFLTHISFIMSEIEAKLVKGSKAELENQLTTKIGCFQLMELLYSRLTKDEVNSKNSVINEKYCQTKVETGKEMTQKATKCAHEARSEDTRGETELVELRRQYHCTAYNLMISIISCTQTEAKFYNCFLFSEKPSKGQFLLDNILDCEKMFEFKAELDSPLERKKRFVSIRNEVKETRQGEEEESLFSSYNISTQNIEESSLSDDLNQYDFNSGTAQVFFSDIFSDLTSSSNVQPDQFNTTVDYIELELDELNQHECMATMVALIKHLHTVITPVLKGTIPKEMPTWMSYFSEKMTNPATSFNIKLFIARLIFNTSEVFQPYTKFWLRPLCQLIFSGPLSSDGINYFNVDLIVMMMSWHTTSIPQDTAEERAMSSRLVQFLMANIYHKNKQIYRNNLEMLKTVLECWHDRIEIPYKIIYNQLKSEENKSVGIQLLGVVITCKFPPYGPDCPVDRHKFFTTVAFLMCDKSKPVYTATGEVVGMILKYLEVKEQETEGEFHTYIINNISSLQLSKPDNFIYCIHKIHQQYPPTADRLLNKLLFMLPNLNGESRRLCLEVVHGRIGQIDNVFMELKTKGLLSFLTQRNEKTQLVALNIITSIREKLKSKEMSSLMDSITAFSHHPSTLCRKVMFELLMWIYDNYREDECTEGHEIMLKTKECLLKGLGDEDMMCRLLVQNFWSSDTRLPTGTLDRMVAMLEAMYSPSTEQQYLSYATNLLLEMTTKSPDYQREIFEHPLSECRFQEFSVKSSWKQRHAAMTPLFAATISTVSESMEGVEDSLDGGVRATQDVQFTATQDAGSNAPFNWLTGSSLDTYGDYGSMSSSETPSSLLFSVGTSGSQSTNKRQSKAGFGLRRQTIVKQLGHAPKSEGMLNKSDTVWKLRRRFQKDKDDRLFFMKKNVRLRKREEERLMEQKSRRENQVTMYRKYRTGDLPDIQIKHSYIIAPLQALAHRDSTIAKLLFSSLFKAIYKKMDEVKTEREMEETIELINTSVETMFNTTSQYYPPFLSCIMDIVYVLRSRLKISPSNLSTCAIVSSLQPLGIVVLEEQLIQTDSTEQRGNKRRKTEGTTVSTDVNLWIEMARLYKSVENYDVLHGIFSGKIDTKPITQEAMMAESKGDYQTANKLYDEALSIQDWAGEDPLEAEIDFWDDSRMQCLDHLTQWKDLETVCLTAIDNTELPNLDKVWEDTLYQEHYLPYIIRSKLKLLLLGGDQQSLLTFVDTSMKTTEYRAVLESRYSMELSLMYLWQDNYDRARHYANLALQKFLQDWSSTDTLIVASRTSQLQTLQPLVELHEFLTYISNENDITHTTANQLLKSWQKRQPHKLLDPVNIWDDVISQSILYALSINNLLCFRNVYLDHISQCLAGKNKESQEMDEGDMFHQSKLRLYLAMAESCKEQNNIALTLRILKKTNSAIKSVDNEELKVEWSQLYASTHQKKIISNDWSEDGINGLLTTIGKFNDSDVLKSKPDLYRRHHVLTATSYELLAESCLAAELPQSLSSKTCDKLKNLLKTDNLDKTQVNIVSDLLQKSHQELKSAISDSVVTRSRSESFTEADAQIALSKFCDKFLRMKENEEEHIKEKVIENYGETIIICLLKAMKLGSMEAIERFPRLLQFVELYPDTMPTFIKMVSENRLFPLWMFLLWINQMMALIDKTESPAVQPILLQIGTEYPQAIAYPFRISCEGFEFEDSAQGKKNKEAVKKLASILTEDKVPLVNKFISALDQFGQPEMLFKDWTDDIKKMLQSKNRNKSKIMEKYKEIYNMLIEYKETQDTSSTQLSYMTQTTNVGMGEYRKKFADTFKKDFDIAFGKNGEKLASMSIKKGRGKLVPPLSLHEYCQWLADFNPNRDSRELEIPGQYDGLSKPLPEYHVKVAGFDERVLVMSSLRRPKRITIRGNDEKDYHYLVKGGEDLRQDARIEQLFVIMNKVFDKDPVCRHRKLHLKTYQVIPMTPRVGLIEWMNNTTPLKDFVYGALTEQERKYILGDQGPGKQHENWTYKYFDAKKRCIKSMYQKVYQNYSRAETIKDFRMKENKVPWDLFRRAFHQMSTSPEAFHVLRCELVVTHATISICQYFLGIGDRHLSNFMINLKTGGMVGIDFGHNFGSATQFLPVPELMPFRLTRQIINLTLPLGIKGLLENTMIHTTRALRQDYDLLVNTMDVFVKEPSVDWLNFAEKQRNEMLMTADDEESTWYPKQKLQYALRKFKGDNPCHITKDELYLGHSRSPAIKHFEKCVLGDAKDNVRATLPSTGLTVEQQVEALIDQATDPNILGRVWQGWEAWV
ncbi:hypothetical protein LOTGIDRAFT_143667, partial [Lottia gigantea]